MPAIKLLRTCRSNHIVPQIYIYIYYIYIIIYIYIRIYIIIYTYIHTWNTKMGYLYIIRIYIYIYICRYVYIYIRYITLPYLTLHYITHTHIYIYICSKYKSLLNWVPAHPSRVPHLAALQCAAGWRSIPNDADLEVFAADILLWGPDSMEQETTEMG